MYDILFMGLSVGLVSVALFLNRIELGDEF